MSYTLYYWDIGFRGNFVRCILEYVGASYTESTQLELLKLKNASPEDSVAQFMAPPLLHDKEMNMYISQSAAIVTHLARKYNLIPDDIKKLTVAEKVLHDCNDVLIDFTRNCGANMWDQDNWDSFVEVRFVKWLRIFEVTACLQGLEENSGFFLGTKKATFADTSVVALWYTMQISFPELKPLMYNHAPFTMKLCERMVESNENLSNLFTRMNGKPYCGGEIEKSLRVVVPISLGFYVT